MTCVNSIGHKWTKFMLLPLYSFIQQLLNRAERAPSEVQILSPRPNVRGRKRLKKGLPTSLCASLTPLLDFGISEKYSNAVATAVPASLVRGPSVFTLPLPTRHIVRRRRIAPRGAQKLWGKPSEPTLASHDALPGVI